MDDKREIVKTKDNNGKKLELAVLRPTNKIAQRANMAYNLKRSQLIREGGEGGERLLLRSEVEEYLTKAGIWTHKDALRMEQLGTKVRACEMLLRKGGIKLSEARLIAIRMSEMRNEMMELYNKRQQLDDATVESVAENYRFNVLVAMCAINTETGLPYFKNEEDYIERGDEEASIAVAQALAKMLYGLEEDYKSVLFEVRWLKEAGFMNDGGRYVDRDGRFVDRDGRLINEEGRYVNTDGQFVDKFGRLVDDSGDFIVPDPQPFVDDNGAEIYIGQTEVVVSEKPKTKTRKKKATKRTIKKRASAKKKA